MPFHLASEVFYNQTYLYSNAFSPHVQLLTVIIILCTTKKGHAAAVEQLYITVCRSFIKIATIDKIISDTLNHTLKYVWFKVWPRQPPLLKKSWICCAHQLAIIHDDMTIPQFLSNTCSLYTQPFYSKTCMQSDLGWTINYIIILNIPDCICIGTSELATSRNRLNIQLRVIITASNKAHLARPLISLARSWLAKQVH